MICHTLAKAWRITSSQSCLTQKRCIWPAVLCSCFMLGQPKRRTGKSHAIWRRSFVQTSCGHPIGDKDVLIAQRLFPICDREPTLITFRRLSSIPGAFRSQEEVTGRFETTCGRLNQHGVRTHAHCHESWARDRQWLLHGKHAPHVHDALCIMHGS